MEANNDNRPKMLRMPAKDLFSIKCAAAHSTRDTILNKDAQHPPTEPTLTSVSNNLIDFALTKLHFISQNLNNLLKTLMISSLKNKHNKDPLQIK